MPSYDPLPTAYLECTLCRRKVKTLIFVYGGWELCNSCYEAVDRIAAKEGKWPEDLSMNELARIRNNSRSTANG